MEPVRARFELRVGTLVSQAALATFGVEVSPTAVPRDTVFRFRVPADRDLSDVIRQLTENRVQILEIRCSEPPHGGPAEASPRAPAPDAPDAGPGGVVLPFRRPVGRP